MNDFLLKSLNAEELALQMISVLSSVECSNLIAVMRNGASVNATAMCTLKIMYPEVLHIRCISHTIDLIGDKVKVLQLGPLWISYFSHSSKLKALWKA